MVTFGVGKTRWGVVEQLLGSDGFETDHAVAFFSFPSVV
jgi:hypothetical protein